MKLLPKLLIGFLLFTTGLFFLILNTPKVSAETIVKDIGVAGDRAWTDTGIDLVPNDGIVDIVTIRSSSMWGPGQIYYFYNGPGISPQGVPNCIAGSSFVAPGLLCYSLIMRIGNGLPFQTAWYPTFSLYSPETTFTPTTSGRLYFGFNDEVLHFSDNSGSWGLRIIVNRFVAPTPTPTPTPTPIPTPVPSKTPLIFIPGIAGSELKAATDILWSSDNEHGGLFTNTYKAGDVIWVNNGEAIKPGDDDYFDVLRMYPDGTISQANLALTGNLYAGAYQGAINFFTSNGYTLNQNFFVFPYDWRLDLAGTASLLDQKIQDIKRAGSAKVDIVAHSMGGLVARNYIADATRAQNVRKLINLGTPHLGSVKFIKAVNEGICLIGDTRIGCLSIAPSEVKDVLQNMPGGYALLPSAAYYQFYDNRDVDHIFPVRDDADTDQNSVTGPLTFDQTRSWLINLGRNATVFNMANDLHNILDPSFTNTNGVDTVLIAGSGLPTLGQIHTYLKTNWLGQQKKEQEEFYINGDQTVPLFSASLTDGATSLAGTNKIYYVNQEHGALAETGSGKPALPLVISLLNNQSLPNGVATTPFSFSGTAVSTHSPVELHVYDSANKHTGPTTSGEFETQIPGSFYDTTGESKYVFLPLSGQYRFEIKGTDNGTFDLKLQNYNDNQLTNTTIYLNVPVNPTTIVKANYNSNSSLTPQLQVDANGDGNNEKIVNATTQVSNAQTADATPPTTTVAIQGAAGQNNWYRSDVTLTLTSEDNINGAGILTTEYSLDNGVTIQTYTDSITLTDSAKIKFRSIDKAGNEEIPQEIEIKIDKNPPEANVFIDQDKQDMVVEGIDDNLTTVTRQDNTETKKKDDAVYTITDPAGNTLKLDVRERDKEKQDRFRVYSLQYNNDSPIVLENNHFNVSYQGKKGKLNVKEQNFEVKGEIKIRIQYNAKKNQSTIILKIAQGEKVKEIIPGLLLLKLITGNGQLYPQF